MQRQPSSAAKRFEETTAVTHCRSLRAPFGRNNEDSRQVGCGAIGYVR